MTNFAPTKPKVIAKMMRMATEPLPIVEPVSSHVLFELSATCTRPLAILKRKTPGIIDTTDAKPIAANGMCQRRETGVRTRPTMRQATKAPVEALAPKTLSAVHLTAWATMPTATGQQSIRRGVEKKML